jgi:hypothetical protein
MNILKSLTATLALAGLSSAALASGSLVFSAVNSNAQVGDAVVVQVLGTGFTDNVVGGGFSMSFNAALLSLSSVIVNTVEWEFATNPGTIDNGAGTLTDVWFNAFAAPLPTGNFPIATLTFSALAPGVSPLSLLASASFPFANDLVEVIDVSYGSGSITVSAVPEPSTWGSMALGLALLPLVRRRLALA